jgi:hypothetical protein
MRIAMAHFPHQKTLESFNFKFQLSIDAKQIRELATGCHIQSGEQLAVARSDRHRQVPSRDRARYQGLRARGC